MKFHFDYTGYFLLLSWTEQKIRLEDEEKKTKEMKSEWNWVRAMETLYLHVRFERVQIVWNKFISTELSLPLSLSQFCLENKRDYTFHLANLVSIIGCNCKTDWKRIVQCTAMITLNFRLELDRERAKCNWTFFQTQIVHLTLLPVLPCILAAIQRLTVTSEPNIVDRINRLFHISSIPFSWTHTSKSTLAYIHTLSNESSWFIERFEPSVHALLVQTHLHT